MTEELSLQCPYKVFIDFDSNIYYFQTNTGASYEILFMDGKELFISTLLEGCEISNIVINKTRAGTGKRDPEIGKTIEAIIGHFFIDQNRILFYTCDPTDKKHFFRNRLFDYWFIRSPLGGSINKLDCQIGDGKEVYLTSMIYHKDNRMGNTAIAQTFKEVTYVLSESK